MDLFSQAEHHETSQAILVFTRPGILERVHESMGGCFVDMPRAESSRSRSPGAGR